MFDVYSNYILMHSYFRLVKSAGWHITIFSHLGLHAHVILWQDYNTLYKYHSKKEMKSYEIELILFRVNKGGYVRILLTHWGRVTQMRQ